MQRLVRLIAIGSLIGATLSIASDVTCPIDRLGMHFTGKTRIEMGKMLYQYKCPNGHVTWIVQ